VPACSSKKAPITSYTWSKTKKRGKKSLDSPLSTVIKRSLVFDLWAQDTHVGSCPIFFINEWNVSAGEWFSLDCGGGL
jgi:hypothetical protein